MQQVFLNLVNSDCSIVFNSSCCSGYLVVLSGRSSRCFFRVSILAIFFLTLNIKTAFQLHAGEIPADDDKANVSHWEVWNSAGVTSNSVFGSAGIVLAPFDNIIDEGWRLRATGGYGLYLYGGERLIRGRIRDVIFTGNVTLGDLMLGYQWRIDDLTLKAFAGAETVEHIVTPFDAGNAVQGRRTGAKIALEGWLNVGEGGWVSGNASASAAFATVQAEARVGYRVWRGLGLGLEVGVYRNETLGIGHAGAVASYVFGFGEVTVSGGISGDYESPGTPYANITLLKRF